MQSRSRGKQVVLVVPIFEIEPVGVQCTGSGLWLNDLLCEGRCQVVSGRESARQKDDREEAGQYE